MSRYVWNNETMRMEEVPMTEDDLFRSPTEVTEAERRNESEKSVKRSAAADTDESLAIWRQAAAEITEEAEIALDSAKIEALGIAPSKEETKPVRAPPEPWIDPKRQLDPDGYKQERKAMNESDRQAFFQKYNIKHDARSKSPTRRSTEGGDSFDAKTQQKPGWLDEIYDADPSDLWDFLVS